MPTLGETFWKAVARIAAEQRKIPDAIRRLADVPSGPINMNRLRARRSRKEKRMEIVSIVDECARYAYEAIRAHCKANGDSSQPRWEDAPKWQKDTIFKGVYAVRADPEMTPEESHESWMQHKIAEGWVYGPMKNVEEKRHPCLVPYAQLPEAERVKDAIFIAVVRAVPSILRGA